MAYVNWVTYEAQLKVVYYGPAYAGKTTSLRYLSLRLETDVKELPTTDDRSVFFEYAQSQKLPANQLEVKFLYWTLPGQQKYRRTRHLVLAATDAVVFVADSQYEAASMNLEMLNDLEELLSDRGMCLEGRQNLALQQIPIVFFYNKRDLPDIMPVQYMDALFGLHVLAGAAFYRRGDGREKCCPSRKCGGNARTEAVGGKNLWSGEPGCARRNRIVIRGGGFSKFCWRLFCRRLLRVS